MSKLRSGFGFPEQSFATTKTLEIVINSKNNYFIQVKRNQRLLYEKIQSKFNTEITLQHNSKEIAVKHEINKGREELRVCYKIQIQDPQIQYPDWKGLKTVIVIQTIVKQTTRSKLTGEVSFRETLNQNYFISSQPESAKYYLDLKRKHWSIEAFHYIKDITYQEDSSKITKGNSPSNNAFFRSLAVILYKSIGSTNQAQSIRLFGNKISRLFKVIQSF